MEDELKTYIRIRDEAIHLIEEGRYLDAAIRIESYPREQRSSIYWLERLAPLHDEAVNLHLAQTTYYKTAPAAEYLLERGDADGAFTLLQSYPQQFAHTEWGRKISELLSRAEEIRQREEKSRLEKKEKSEEPRKPPEKEEKRDTEKKSAVPPVPPKPELPPQKPEPPTPAPETPEPKGTDLPKGLKEKIDAAIKRGIADEENQQRADGSFNSNYFSSYPMGATALPTFTLLSCGTKKDSAAINRSFDCLSKLPFQRTYCVSLLLMAIEARYQPDKEQMEKSSKPFATEVRENFHAKASPRDRKLAEEALKWLTKAQLQSGYWTYNAVSITIPPETARQGRVFTPSGDGSNAQFAVLALYAALRLGLDVPQETMRSVARALIALQEQSGKSVKSFCVPAADFSISDLRKVRKRHNGKKE